MFSATTLSSSLLIWSLCSPHYALAAATRKQTIQAHVTGFFVFCFFLDDGFSPDLAQLWKRRPRA